MKRLTSLVCLILAVSASMALAAGTTRDPGDRTPADARFTQMPAGVLPAAKAAVDTVYILGGPARQDGKFQDNTGTLPDREGWTSVDATAKTAINWSVTTFNSPNPGSPAAWCGEILTACPGGDSPQGYRNNYDERLDWYGTVADNSLPTSVTVQALLNYDSEPGYDFTYLEVERAAGLDPILTFTGSNRDSNNVFVPVVIDETFSVGTADYVGPGLNQVHIRWHVVADGAWSDSDCLWATDGACQIDNVVVKFGTTTVLTSNFDTGLAPWTVSFPPSVGDFAKVWPRLNDIDACGTNITPQFAFIDDGVVVPGTGGTPGVTWTYGPGGYCVNPYGGLGGNSNGYYMTNSIWSPVVAYPAGYDGCRIEADVYRHLPLSNGMFYTWGVRGSTDGGVTWSAWKDRNFVYYGTAFDYLRIRPLVSDLLPANMTHVQMQLACEELAQYDTPNPDPTPAPYFDNVGITAFTLTGPAFAYRSIDIPNDGFPAIGTIDYANLGANDVRIDMARNIAPRTHFRNDPGDSAYVDLTARSGAALTGRPVIYVRMKANPLFDAFRTLPANFTQTGNFIDGFMVTDTTKNATGAVTPNRWKINLPDTDFLYPGDVIHWYIRGEDNKGGNIGVTLLPRDTTGFSIFPGHPDYVHLRYLRDFIFGGLPTMTGATVNDQPKILFWNDFDTRGGEDEWIAALRTLGYAEGVDYDVYYTKGPSSGVGNGLGGRASPVQLAGYRTMLYSTGDVATPGFSNGDTPTSAQTDPGNDIGTVDGWLQRGGKNFFGTGDDWVLGLNSMGAAGSAFINTWLSCSFIQTDVRPLIGNQTSPRVLPIAGNAVGLNFPFVAYGGCFIINRFDAITANAPATRILEFANPAGAGGAYAQAAGVYNNVAAYTAKLIYFPFDLMYVIDPADAAPQPLPARTRVLQRILTFFGEAGTSPVTDVPEAGVFSAKAYPNPFNPITKIHYSLPKAGELSVRIYNVRGELVRTLHDGYTEQLTGDLQWNGTNDGGQSVASGVYFYQVKTAGNEVFNKMTLVK